MRRLVARRDLYRSVVRARVSAELLIGSDPAPMPSGELTKLLGHLSRACTQAAPYVPARPRSRMVAHGAATNRPPSGTLEDVEESLLAAAEALHTVRGRSSDRSLGARVCIELLDAVACLPG